jgi:hypothetical protein
VQVAEGESHDDTSSKKQHAPRYALHRLRLLHFGFLERSRASERNNILFYLYQLVKSKKHVLISYLFQMNRTGRKTMFSLKLLSVAVALGLSSWSFNPVLGEDIRDVSGQGTDELSVAYLEDVSRYGVDPISDNPGPTQVATLCFKTGEQTSGFNKICYYDCLGSAVAITIKATQLCPITINQ